MREIRADRRLWWALALSVILHGVTLSLLPYQGSSGRTLKQVLSVTLIQKPIQEHTASVPESLPLDIADAVPAQTDLPAPSAKSGGEGFGLIPSPPEPLLPPVTYYTTNRLTRPPQVDIPPELDAPELEKTGGTGAVVLQLWISDRGNVIDAIVEKSDLPEAFAKHSIMAFRNARFHPGEINGVPVRSQVHIEVSYEVHRNSTGIFK